VNSSCNNWVLQGYTATVQWMNLCFGFTRKSSSWKRGLLPYHQRLLRRVRRRGRCRHSQEVYVVFKRVKYCNAICQKKHWAKHKKDCKKIGTAECRTIREEALFIGDPLPPKGGLSHLLPTRCQQDFCHVFHFHPATLSSVPVKRTLKQFSVCCGKSICSRMRPLIL